MIKSMTGFGRAEVVNGNQKITVEMKSVNHRYLDFNIKMPKKFSMFESSIRSLLKEYMQRGKVDIFISFEDLQEASVNLSYHAGIAQQYVENLRHMSEEFGLPFDLTASGLGRFPEVLVMDEVSVDEEELWQILEQALRKAAEAFSESRSREGEALRTDILAKLAHMDENVSLVKERAPGILEDYKERLKLKTKELLEDVQIDESRIAAEVILFADKICTDEETVRLSSHIDHMRQSLMQGAGIGRKLDFIAQEMNREANTILSKANDLETSNIAIDLKTEIEKVREQIQNIE